MLGNVPRAWGSRSQIQALVDQACDPTLLQANDMVNIELAESISKKKANSAREATQALVTYINSRNPNQALLALTVLDYLVKNCGYPIHLQISTKDFLNELVRRFPERPPMVIGRVMGRILEMIHEWKNTICVTSKYKDDLVHIRDMHRLLSYKGYRFKAFDAARALATSNPNANLKSPEELEEEDRAAKSAKLQELIRRGTPRDLAQAQELMKYLSGAEPDKQINYEKQTLQELEKLQSKAILLNDMLDNAKEGERIGLEGDVYDQVASACRGARPKIQKWIEDDTGEHEGLMDRLLLCNDIINAALERYEALKKGDYAAAQRIVDQSKPGANKATDLISFDAFADDDEGPSSSASPAPGVALPSGTAAEASASNPGFTTGGLPLDLFAPSPSASPAPAAGPSSTRPRQDPMAFFSAAPAPAAQQTPYGGQLAGLFQTQPTQQQQPYHQPQQQQQQYPQFAHPQPTQPQSQFNIPSSAPGFHVPNTNGRPAGTASGAGSGAASPAPAPAAPAGQKKNDAFADLMDLL